MTTIYIKLLNEGTNVYRPVPSLKKDDNIYEVLGKDIYDSQDETWEFPPGSIVVCEWQKLSGGDCLVATFSKYRGPHHQQAGPAFPRHVPHGAEGEPARHLQRDSARGRRQGDERAQ